MSKNFATHALIEFGPIASFFLVSVLFGFYPGATVLVIATLSALAFSALYFKRFALFSFTVSSTTLVSGFATLYFHQPIWIVLEFTISNLIFGTVLVCTRKRQRLILESLFNHMFSINQKGWRKLTHRWGWAFTLIGVSNQLFWYWFPDEDRWTAFRFVVTLLTFAFALCQFRLSKRERLPDASVWGLRH